MKIEIEPTSPGSDTLQVRLSHGSQYSLWDVKAYSTKSADRVDQLTTDGVFREINAFWASRPTELQEQIWLVYQSIRDLLDTNYEITAIKGHITKKVKELYNLMPLAGVIYWANFQGLRPPGTLSDTHTDPSRERRTYLKEDYRELVGLAIALRGMMPIWGEFLDKAKAESGTPFKELSALSLLYDSDLILSPPMERLRVYIKASLEESNDYKVSAAAVLGGLGTEELPEWLLSLTVVRRLTVGEVVAREDNSSLISNIWQFIAHQIRQLDRKFQGRISDKPNPQSYGEENKTSVAEQYKIKQEVADGNVVTINVYTEGLYDMVMRVDPTIPIPMIDLCMQHVKQMEVQEIERHQVALAQWTMKSCIPPRGVQLLEKPALLRVLAATQAALWHWEFFDLAGLVTVVRLPARRDEMRQALETRGRVPKELVDQLNQRYTYSQFLRKQHGDRQRNPGYISIDRFCELIGEADWQLLAPPALVEKTQRHQNSRRLIVPMDIRTQLARLILKIAH